MHLGPMLRAMLHNKTKVLLLVVEISFTVAIVLNCLSLILEQRDQLIRPTGIAEEDLLVITTSNWGADHQDLAFRWQQIDRDLEALRALPGVRAATPTTAIPLQGGGSAFQVKPLGAPDSELVRSPVYTMDHQALETLGLELVAGRNFTPEDRASEPGPYIANILVTQDLADALFPDGNAVGQTVWTGSEEYPDVIIGIVDHMFTPYGGGPLETRITFYTGRPAFSRGTNFLLRAEPGMLDEVYAAADSLLLEADGERVASVQTLLEVKAGGFLLNRFLIGVLGMIVVLLLFVTGLGIFGMTSFSVAQRTKQVGTRRALGASRASILGYFLLENTLITAGGLGLGLLGAYGLNIVIMQQTDARPLSFGLVLAGALLLWLVSLLASAAPARNASRLPPALATRTV
ncbi:MAG: FtsX-like permease family protein [Holophagales bacterium]|nr:FtsX-like permease family protein [Holophagales bacterium]